VVLAAGFPGHNLCTREWRSFFNNNSLNIQRLHGQGNPGGLGFDFLSKWIRIIRDGGDLYI
jgi:hypothetical protein